MSDRLRVLFVDADAEFADVAATFLERADDRIAVFTATDATEALAQLEEEPFDCVVSEYHVPGCNGLQFLERVRALDPDLPFVMFTSGASEEIASEAISAGVTDYVIRQSGTDQFEELAERILEAAGRYRTDLADERPERGPRDTRDLLGNIIEQVPLHMYVKDAQARHLWVSGYYVDDTEGVPDAADHVGKTDLELYPEEFARDTYEDDLRVIETGEPVVDKEEYEPAAGEWNLTTKVPWYDESGEIVGLIGVTRRITRRKEYEKRLERQNERLDEFASIVSHDLRNPLTAAEGRLELAREEYDSDHLEEAAESVDRMSRMVDDLLALAREGDQALDAEPVSLRAVVERCWETVATPGATLAVESDRLLHADRGHLKQLLENLFRNAVEHASTTPDTSGNAADGTDAADASGHADAAEHADAPEHADAAEHADAPEHADAADAADAAGESDGGQNADGTRGAAATDELTVRVGDLEDGFFVEDDGPGIPAGERERVFETGYSEYEEGTGLGLSIVRRTAQMHDWAVELTESEAGGARFEFTGVRTED